MNRKHIIHREGYKIIIPAATVLAVLLALIAMVYGPGGFLYIFSIASSGFMIFLLRFFRDPGRKPPSEDDMVYAPADGRIVQVQETEETEYFGDTRIQVSIFMSIWDVHINWFPVPGTIVYNKYHPGRYLVARHPKSSKLNERSTSVVRAANGTEILVSQIAGFVARRIISYASVDKDTRPGDEIGFIRFGSRVDVFLPPGTRILVTPGQRVTGLATPIARI